MFYILFFMSDTQSVPNQCLYQKILPHLQTSFKKNKKTHARSSHN